MRGEVALEAAQAVSNRPSEVRAFEQRSAV